MNFQGMSDMCKMQCHGYIDITAINILWCLFDKDHKKNEWSRAYLLK